MLRKSPVPVFGLLAALALTTPARAMPGEAAGRRMAAEAFVSSMPPVVALAGGVAARRS